MTSFSSFENRFGFKECNEAMVSLEGRLESLLGALHVQMKGLQGFARLCAGDVFEISLRHGSQKWRSRGKVGRDGSSQKWDSTAATFRLSLDQMLFIRAVEIRSLGKQILLGNKFCETLDLLSPQPQMMTVSLTSSLKLNLVVTWDPLYGADPSPPATTPISTVRSRIKSSLSSISGSGSGSGSPDLNHPPPSRNSERLKNLFQQMQLNRDDDDDDDEEEEEEEKPEALVTIRHPSPDYHLHSSRDSLAGGGGAEAGRQSAEPAKSDGTGNFLLVRRMNQEASAHGGWYYSSPTHTVDSGYEDSASSTSKRHRTILSQAFFKEEPESPVKKDADDTPADWSVASGSLDSVVRKLRDSIATDLQGQYAELELFESTVATLHRLVKIQTDPSAAAGSNLQTTEDVNDALEAFDFLDSEGGSHEEAVYANLETAKDPPAILFTKQLDETLLMHLKYSRSLTKDLGNYGPLKTREAAALTKLPVQGRILAKLAKLIEKWLANPTVKLSIHEELRGLPHLQKLWGVICAEDRSLSVSCQDAFVRLVPLCRQCLAGSASDLQERSLQLLIARCQDVPEFRPSGRLTVFQFRYFVRSKERSFATRLEEIRDELTALDALESKDPSLIQKTMTRISRHPDQHNVEAILVKVSYSVKSFLWRWIIGGPFQQMSHLLDDPGEEKDVLRSLVTRFLQDKTAKEANPDWRRKLLDAFVGGLESRDAADREGSCHALALLHQDASSVVDQLAFVAQSDASLQVRKRAKTSLESLGPDGRQALHNIQLSSHGFQGVSVRS